MSLKKDYLQSFDELFTDLGIVVWRLSDQKFVVLGSSSKIIVVKMVEDLKNTVHVLDDSLLDGMLNSKHTLLGGDFVTNVAVFLVHTDKGTL